MLCSWFAPARKRGPPPRRRSAKEMFLRRAQALVARVPIGAASSSIFAAAPTTSTSNLLSRVFARTAVFKSQAVQRWLGDRAIESPTEWRPWKWNGRWNPPQIGRKRQALLVKEAIRRGDIKLEPTVMVPPPKFKGHKSQAARPIRRAEVAQKMAEMPKMIAEYLRERREKRAKERANNRWK